MLYITKQCVEIFRRVLQNNFSAEKGGSDNLVVTKINSKGEDYIKNKENEQEIYNFIDSLDNVIKKENFVDSENTKKAIKKLLKIVGSEGDLKFYNDKGIYKARLKVLCVRYIEDYGVITNETKQEIQYEKFQMENLSNNGKDVTAIYESGKYNDINLGRAIGVLLKLSENKGLAQKVAKLIYKYVDISDALKDNESSVDKSSLKKERSKLLSDIQILFTSSELDYVFKSKGKKKKEIENLIYFLKKELGGELFNIRYKGQSGVSKKMKEELKTKYSKKGTSIDIARDVEKFDIGNVTSLLGFICDFGGEKQGETANGQLTTTNSVVYGNFFKRLFGMGKLAQKEIVGEVQLMEELSMNIKSVDKLKSLIAELVFNGDTKKVDDIFATGNEQKVKKLLIKFRDIGLSRVGQIRDIRGFTGSNEEFNGNVIEQAQAQISNVEEMANSVAKTEGFQNAVKSLVGRGVQKHLAEKSLRDWTVSLLSTPKIFAGLNFNVTETITKTKYVDYLGNLLNETESKSTKLEATPYVLLGLDVVSVKFRKQLQKDGLITAGGGIGVTGALGLDGLALPVSAKGNIGLTLNDRNKYISGGEKLKGNWKIVLGGGLGTDILKDGKLVLSASADLNWNDKIDAVEKEITQYKNLLEDLIDNKTGQLKKDGIKNSLNKVQKERNRIQLDPNFTDTLALDVLEKNLYQLEAILGQIDKIPNDTDKNGLKATVLNTWLKSIVSDYEMNLKDTNSGMNLAGLHIGYIFVANVLNLGLNFQNIEAAYISSSESQRQMDYENQKRYKFDSKIKVESIKAKCTKINESEMVIPNEIIPVFLKDGNKIELKAGVDYSSLGIEISEGDNNSIIVKSIDGLKLSLDPFYVKNSDKTTTTGVIIREELVKRTAVKKTISVERLSMSETKDKIDGMFKGKLNLEQFKRKLSSYIHKGTRLSEAKIEGLTDYNKIKSLDASAYSIGLMNSIEKFLSRENNGDLFKTYIKAGPTLFQGQNKIKIEEEGQLKLLATYIAKLSWGDSTVGGKKVKIEKNKKHFGEVLEAEKKVFNNYDFNGEIMTQAKSQALKEKTLSRQNLAEKLTGKNYARVLSMVSSTPSGNNGKNHRLIPIVDTIPEVYGDLKSIEDVAAKKQIINYFKDYIEEHLASINNSLKAQLKDESFEGISFNQYKEMILNGSMGTIIELSNGSKLSLKMSESLFASFNAGFEGNECFNASATLVLGKIKGEVLSSGDPIQLEELSDIGTPYSKMDQATIGISFKRVVKEKTKVVEVKAEGEKEKGDKEAGEKEEGDKEAGEKEEGDKEEGEKEEGDKEAGEKEEGDKEAGEKEEGDKEAGEKEEGDKEAGEKEEGDKESGDKERGDKERGDKERGDKEEGDKERGDKERGDKERGDKESGDKERGDKESGDKERGDKERGDKERGDKESGEKESGEKESGDKESGEKESGEKESGEKESGEKESGDKESGEKESGEKESGEKESGDKESGEKESGEKESGEKEAGDKESGDSEAGDVSTDPDQDIDIIPDDNGSPVVDNTPTPAPTPVVDNSPAPTPVDSGNSGRG